MAQGDEGRQDWLQVGTVRAWEGSIERAEGAALQGRRDAIGRGKGGKCRMKGTTVPSKPRYVRPLHITHDPNSCLRARRIAGGQPFSGPATAVARPRTTIPRSVPLQLA